MHHVNNDNARCHCLNTFVSPEIYMLNETLTPKVIVQVEPLEGGTGHEGGDLIDGISAYIKEPPETSFSFAYVRIRKKSTTWKAALTQPHWHTNLGLPALPEL